MVAIDNQKPFKKPTTGVEGVGFLLRLTLCMFEFSFLIIYNKQVGSEHEIIKFLKHVHTLSILRAPPIQRGSSTKKLSGSRLLLPLILIKITNLWVLSPPLRLEYAPPNIQLLEEY